MPTAEEIEAAARVITRMVSIDPDGFQTDGTPNWKTHMGTARAALVAAENVRKSSDPAK
jgi:hypothetical protein